MNALEMIERLEAGEQPIDVSILKWKEILDNKADVDSGMSPNNCALCWCFFDNICIGCPLVKYGVGCRERGSLWQTFEDVVDMEGCPDDSTLKEIDNEDVTHAAQDMLDALLVTKQKMIENGEY